MIIASLYIVWCSARNRVRVRLRRLREPRYLIGAIVGVAYLYLTIFGRTLGRRASSRRLDRTPQTQVALTQFASAGPAFGGLVLMVLMALAWIFPGDSGLLEFTEAETQILFPAPVSRRALLVHRLLRSQLGVLFAAIVPSLIFPAGGVASRLRLAVGLWILLSTFKVHFTGITLARSSLALSGADASRRQWRPLAIMVVAIAIVARAIVGALRAGPLADVGEVSERIVAVTATGLPMVILWPFKALVAPIFAPWPGPYLLALAGALVVLGANVAWVLHGDASLQEATAQAQARRAAKNARKQPAVRARVTSWQLAPTGRAEGIFVWKNAMQMLRESNAATLLRYGAPLIAVTIAMTSIYMGKAHMRGAAGAFGGVAAMVAAMAVLLGPQLARTDLRQDLLHLEVLKTWPMRPADVVRGEMIWPAAIVTGVAWTAIACATMLWTPVLVGTSMTMRLSLALAAITLAPALVFAQFTIHNAAAVLFPAWVPLGSARPKGIDAMGQRLLLFAAIMLGLVVMMAPGALVASVLWFAFERLVGPVVFVPAAIACTGIVLVEVLAVTEALGPAYERLDLSAVEREE